jgi:RNA polymerase sigma-70 factor (ECF subfamily)
MIQPGSHLRTAYEAGEVAWPGVKLSFQDFVARIDAAGISKENLIARSAEVFLAMACAAGDPVALRRFDDDFLSQVDSYVARFCLPPHVVDHIRQRVRVRLLVGSRPGIGGYGGRGPLGAWLRVTAVRVAIDASAVAPDVAPFTELLDVGVLDANPELETIRTLYRDRLRAALEDSLGALDARDRALLRFHVVEGLNVDAIGAIYRVHRATAARWLVAIRGRVFEDLRRRLELAWNPSHSELRSLIGALRDQIHVTAQRVLAVTASAARASGPRSPT